MLYAVHALLSTATASDSHVCIPQLSFAMQQLAREGAHITIIARDIGRLEAALVDIKACAADPAAQQFACLSLPLGGSDFAAVQRGFDEAQAALGPCAALVNCAGIAVPQAFDVMPVEALERMLRTNLLGAMHAARAVVPGMKERQEGGRILFTSSIAGLVGLYGYTGYAATKANSITTNVTTIHCLYSMNTLYTCTEDNILSRSWRCSAHNCVVLTINLQTHSHTNAVCSYLLLLTL
jgi:short chain dehydrogenase